MELSFLVAAGTAGGLGTVVIQQALWPLVRRRETPSNTTSQLVYAVLHTLAGAGLGLLFWLTWGLAALVNVSWWLRGLTFGLLIWSVVVLPTIVISRVETRYSSAALAGIGMEILSTCLLAGLACSWAWTKTP